MTPPGATGEPTSGPVNVPASRATLTVVSGPSGVGKSSVVAEVRRRCPDIFSSVSVTTRAPRPGEIPGKHYHFVDRVTFDRMVSRGELLEHAEYAGNGYGTPREPVRRALESGRQALLEIELQGARQIRAAMPEALLVMLVPPSFDVLEERLVGRATEGQAVLDRRLAVARAELDARDEFDALVLNDEVQRAADELIALMAGTRPSADQPG